MPVEELIVGEGWTGIRGRPMLADSPRRCEAGVHQCREEDV